ncbi:terminase large subunit [Brevundimonas phage vB_BpoS-Babayka]|uniref:Terminase large subunit n=1 Tax=Brevundimonas phage vB_BpoS-Babayka TaxID=2948596 RepID=A0A9E7MUM4_9CAUD|nr:terminase large subunit [Brevundimonas phage vB_BpoS-Babayka]
MAVRESVEASLLRWEQVGLLQRHYESFHDFLDDAFEHLGFSASWVQHDIGGFLAHGPNSLMVQAQRGQAKTTITAAFAVWTLIHNPKARVLILSAGGTQANEISTLIVKLLLTMEELECMRPDASNGDRTSVEAFDVHYTLKGVDKSPSVACSGITGNLQGKRADLLIADDIESAKNSATALMREFIMNLTRDFTSICTEGRIIYLGTPQSMDSIYNSLPGRGFTIRIWPGRYPTPEQLENYGDMLAPAIRRRLALNPALCFGGGLLKDQGQPIEEGEYLGELQLQQKELDQGPSYFQLQHMLNTRLADALRYPLKPDNLVVMRLGGTRFPMTVTRGFGGDKLEQFNIGTLRFSMSRPHELSDEVADLQGTVMYVDPAGGGKNADETGYAVVGFLNGNVFLLDAGGVPGGYAPPTLEALKAVALKWNPQVVKIEKNMGYGAFREVWLPILRADVNGVPKSGYQGSVEEDYVTGQKETRIIDTLEPIMARGALIINEDIVQSDSDSLQRYSPDKRITYSLFHQMSRITRDRGALPHDDRLDAVEGAVRHFVAQIAIDQQAAVKRQEEARLKDWLKDPLGRDRYATRAPRHGGGSLLHKYTRRR